MALDAAGISLSGFRRARFSRRRLLVSGAAATATLMGTARASAGERVVVGVMGLQRGASLAETFAATPGVVVKYLCDVDAARREKAAARLEKVDVKADLTGDYRRMLDDREVDAFVCAAPNHWHATATIQACQAGKHVYVEKPCSQTPQEGVWMNAAAEKHGRIVQVGTQRRSSPPVRDAIERIQNGMIGDVFAARSWYHNKRRSIGRGTVADPPASLDYDSWQGPVPRTPYRTNLIPYNWHWFWDYGNGELGNNGVHGIDLCAWGLGVELPRRVTSTGGRYWFDDDQQTPDTQTVSLDFDGREIVWSGLSCNGHGSGFVTFYGNGGTLEIDADGGYRVFDQADALVAERPGTAGRGQEEHVANFVDAIRADSVASLAAGIGVGHRSALLCHLGNIAQRVGRSLICDPATGAVVDDTAAMEFWSRDYEPGWEPAV